MGSWSSGIVFVAAMSCTRMEHVQVPLVDPVSRTCAAACEAKANEAAFTCLRECAGADVRIGRCPADVQAVETTCRARRAPDRPTGTGAVVVVVVAVALGLWVLYHVGMQQIE